jgi:hypothetical protein
VGDAIARDATQLLGAIYAGRGLERQDTNWPAAAAAAAIEVRVVIVTSGAPH